jgi:hypothetical protein
VNAVETNCARCGRKVKAAENWLKAHLWTSTAVLHWTCFIALLRENGATAAEQGTWRDSRVAAQWSADVERKVEVGK